MTEEEFNKSPLLDQILYDTTGMLVKNHPAIAEAMEIYHQEKLKIMQNNVNKTICTVCGAEESIRWEKHKININDKQGSYKDLTFDICEECGNVTNMDFS